MLPIGGEAQQILDRLEIRSDNPASWPIHSDIQPFSRRNAAQAARYVDSTKAFERSKGDERDLRYLFVENAEWLAADELPRTLAERKAVRSEPDERARLLQRLSKKPFLRAFYKTPANFFEVNSKYFRLKANPALDLSIGKEKNVDGALFFNRRGLDVRGDLDERLFFWTSVYETQARLPDFVQDRLYRNNALPGALLVKSFSSRIFNVQNGVDYLVSTGGIGFYATKHIGVQLAHGTNFIGNGYRSMLLSDFAAPYLHLKLSTQVWRFHYQNIWAELNADAVSKNLQIARKYMAAHYLSFNVSKRFSIGLYEAVMLHRSNHFELQYLNPIIFYRTIEGSIGSSDNVLLGLNARLDLGKRAQLYGQLMLDEFLFRYAVLPKKSEKGWWANKQGFQLGLKIPRFLGADRLDFQAELNGARPYTYAHYDSTASDYAHHNQPLAHPMGANFRELLFRLNWRPTERFSMEGKFFAIKNGEDPAGENYGSNILLNYNSRPYDFGHFIGQGIKTDIAILSLDASWQLFHNCHVDLRGFWREKKSSDLTRNKRDLFLSAGLRLNLQKQRWEF